MSYNLPQDPTLLAPDQASRWFERLLLLAFLFCLVVGLAALAVLWSLRTTSRQPLAGDPLTQIQVDKILPELALRQLAGDSADGLAFQAIQAGQLETARAILAYDTSMTPGNRATRLTQLGRQYLQTEQTLVAGQVFRLVLPEAILDGLLPSLERAQLLTQAAQGLLAADFPDAALETAVQAQRLAAQTPDLLPAQRSQVFNELRAMADRLPDPAFKRQVDDLSRNPYLTPNGVLVIPPQATDTQSLPYDEATEAAIDARRRAATLLADRISLTQGVDVEPERQQLAQALLTEDQARQNFYRRAKSPEISLQEQVWLLLDELDWLTNRLRVARLGFGISLLPEWEQASESIYGEIGGTYASLSNVLDEGFAAAQPTAAEQAMQRVANQYWLAAAVERGLNAKVAPAEIGERIRDAQNDLADQLAPPALPIAYEGENTLPGFRIQVQSSPP